MDKELKNKELEQVSGGNNPFSGDPLLPGRETKNHYQKCQSFIVKIVVMS